MKDDTEDNSNYDNIVKNYISGINKFYPGLRFSSSQGINITAVELELAFNAQATKDTEYELIDSKNLIHYTSSIQDILELLYSGNLRLKNLMALNDPQEMNYIINQLKLESLKSYIENFKSTYFSASFCKVENYNKADEFPMWRLYGGDGYGCAVVFELEEHESNWIDFMIAQIQYGDSNSLNLFNEFMKFHDSYKNQFNFPNNVPITLPALMAFHKNKIWEYEKEVRLLTYQNYDNYNLKSISNTICELKHSIDRNNNKFSYVELPLKGGKQYNEIINRGHLETLNRLVPILRVRKIILGYKVDFDLLYEIERIVGFISITYGYNIEVEISHLKAFMS